MRKNTPDKKKPSRPASLRIVVLGLIAASVLGVVLWRWTARVRGQEAGPASTATYVGQERCGQCHAEQAQAWRTSHHAQAMQVASDSTVLGNFSDAHFTKDGVTSTFFQKDGKFHVNTEGPDAKPQDFDLPYTFGVAPLQQYLVPFPNGRMQAFVVAWDSQRKEQAGQRWFDLYPDQKISPFDPLHWTGRNLNWNYMCAACHSSNLRKNYDLAKDSYATTWSEIDVSCESCHGPAPIMWHGQRSAIVSRSTRSSAAKLTRFWAGIEILRQKLCTFANAGYQFSLRSFTTSVGSEMRFSESQRADMDRSPCGSRRPTPT